MNQSRLQQLIQSAVERGILPKDATLDDPSRPWPIVLLTGVGAWLAAIPLFIPMFLIFKAALLDGPWCYVLGLLLTGGALTALHKPGLPIFAEHMSLPGLLVGASLIGYGVYRDMPYAIAGVLLTAVSLVLAWFAPQNWLRTLLGALACATFVVATSNAREYSTLFPSWNGIHYGWLAWLLARAFLYARLVDGDYSDTMIAAESIANGWILWVLFAITQISGPTFMSGALAGDWYPHELMSALMDEPVQKILSALMTLAAAAWLAYRWPALRAPRYLVASAMLAAFAWLVQTLGAMLLVVAIFAGSGRWGLVAPVDPRSLMQGDYMALNFKVPQLGVSDTSRLLVVAKIDARGIVVDRVKDNSALAGKEILIELIPTGSGLRPASDAWYFKESEADRWAKAKYGEFRIDRQGHALLVGLRGPDLEKL
ncbi:GDYXXLXY domain-containing protein [Janthinobacterium sp. HH01]|uniref:GDYXXLXY domain-containing protein n=1 Tax=Janthinobacterium sp. HH01 TaxID=1198452 RepID=UPI00034B8CEB|nr:GDYXXLXY domain-containing protein [Janthinobacterium sp. HH01]